MKIITSCPFCKTSHNLSADYADKRFKCTKCKNLFKIPKLEEFPDAMKVIENAKSKLYVDKKGNTFG